MAEKSNVGEVVASGKVVVAQSVPGGVRVEAPVVPTPGAIRVEAPAGVVSVSVAGQNFTARDGAFWVPPHFVAALREHFAGLARHAEGVAAKLAREGVAAAKGDVREAMKLLQGELDRLGI